MKGRTIPAAWLANYLMKKQLGAGGAFSVTLNYEQEFLNAEAVNSASAH